MMVIMGEEQEGRAATGWDLIMFVWNEGKERGE
jgi:hypothetical protein